jgi:adenylate cyclase
LRSLAPCGRPNAQLIDAATDTYLWADRFDRDMGDLFALQNEITARIANTLKLKLTAAEAGRPIDHPDALDYIFRGRDRFLGKSPSRANYAEAVGLFEHALALDPQSAWAQANLAGVLVNGVTAEMTASRLADLARAEALVDQALAASPHNAYAHYVKGTVLRAKKRCNDAIPEFEMARMLDQNSIGALQGLGWCKLSTGALDGTILLGEQAIRLSPRDPTIGFRYQMIGTARLLQSHTEEAIVSLEKGRSAMPAGPQLHALLAAAYGLEGETERAAAELTETRRLDPHGHYSSFARLGYGFLEVPKMIRSLNETTYLAGLRKAGMPEE